MDIIPHRIVSAKRSATSHRFASTSLISSGQARAFLYKDGVMTDLGALGGIDSRAISINNQGEIIGHYTLADNSVHAFLYRDGEMIAL